MTINTVSNNPRKQKDQRRLPENWHGRGILSVSAQSDVAAQGFSSVLDDIGWSHANILQIQ